MLPGAGMAGSWVLALGLGLCLSALQRGGCHPPGTAMAPQTAAVLRDNFRLQPSDLVATVGQVLELDCVPPSGHPEPRVTWKKDGVTLDSAGDRYVVTNGKLRVAPAQRSDSGIYVCVAANAAGRRESRGARVSVLEKPTIVRHPSDTVAAAGGTVELNCSAQGDPMPRVQWHKERGDLPWGRHEVDQEHTLRLYAVTLADAGTYVCTAQSQLGTAAATALLRVEERLPPGRRDAAPRDLLAMRLHLDNGTVLPTSAVRLRWRMLMRTPVMMGYMVLYRSLVPTTTSWVQHDAGKELSTIIPALRRGYKYEFKVRPYTGGTQGLDSNSRYLWIPEEVPSAAPRHITVVQAEMGNGTVVVSWDPPPPEAHNGIIRGYKVWSMAEGWQRPTNRTVDGGTHRLETRIPSPGAQLCVRVAAFNGAGLGVPSNATCSAIGVAAGSTGLVRMLRQPVVIAATGSLLWLALLVLLLLLCQRRASRDAAMRRRLVAADAPWLGGPWKPGCAPRNRSSSSSLLGSDGRDPSTLSLEPSSLGPPTPSNHSSACVGHPPPLGDTGCCRGGHPGVRTSPSTPNPAPLERLRKRELQQMHSTPVLTGGPGHVPIHGSGSKWGPDLGLEWPQRRGHDGDTGAVVAGGDRQQLPVFSTPKPRRGSASLASGAARSPVPPPHGWHPPVTRSPATGYPRDTSPGPGSPRDVSPATRHPKDPSPVTKHQRDMSPATRHPKDPSSASRHPEDMSAATGHPRDTSPATRLPKEKSPATGHRRDKFLASRYPEDTSPAMRHPKDTTSASGNARDASPVTSRYPKNMSPAMKHPKDTSPATRNPRDPSPAMGNPRDPSPAMGNPRDPSPATRHPEEMSPVPGHRKDTSLLIRYPEDTSPAVRNPKDTTGPAGNPMDTSPVTRNPEEMSPAPGHWRDMFLGTRYPKDTSGATKHSRDMSPVTSHLSPALSNGLFTQQRVAKEMEVDQDTNCTSPAAPTAPLSFSPLHTYGYIYGPPASELGEEEDEEEDEEQPAARGSPVGSLLNGWGSVSEDNFTSARCSLVSSCDGSFLLDASFARALAVAVDGLCFGLEDTDGTYRGPSPPPSPLERIFTPGVPIPTWEWGTALGIPQRIGMEAAAGTPQCGGHGPGSGSSWARVGGEMGTGGTGAWRSPGCRSRLGSAKIQLY
ncbi:roundabout homolog 4 isoform X2 [Strigops habroptila]|uniref:roundabout homolog 4 isoform X2 n=1 Tax=Strigops habroptila TaxID=2489341 RepID=UPI0011CF8C57|nr:roundabout homolog 4 isoform X2 [Strigops habroptila]